MQALILGLLSLLGTWSHTQAQELELRTGNSQQRTVPKISTCDQQHDCIKFTVKEVPQRNCEGKCLFKACAELDWNKFGCLKNNVKDETLLGACQPSNIKQCPQISIKTALTTNLPNGHKRCQIGSPGQELTFSFFEDKQCESLSADWCLYDRKHVPGMEEQELKVVEAGDASECRTKCKKLKGCNACTFSKSDDCKLLQLTKLTLSEAPAAEKVIPNGGVFAMMVDIDSKCPEKPGTRFILDIRDDKVEETENPGFFTTTNGATVSCARQRTEDLCPRDVDLPEAATYRACAWKVTLPGNDNCKKFCQKGAKCKESVGCMRFKYNSSCACVADLVDEECPAEDCFGQGKCGDDGQCMRGEQKKVGEYCGTEMDCIVKECNPAGVCQPAKEDHEKCGPAPDCYKAQCNLGKGCELVPDDTGCAPTCGKDDAMCVDDAACCDGYKCKSIGGMRKCETCRREGEACSKGDNTKQACCGDLSCIWQGPGKGNKCEL